MDSLWNDPERWLAENAINAGELLGIGEVAETLADVVKVKFSSP